MIIYTGMDTKIYKNTDFLKKKNSFLHKKAQIFNLISIFIILTLSIVNFNKNFIRIYNSLNLKL